MVFVMIMMAIVSLLDLGFGKLVFEIFSGGAPVAARSRPPTTRTAT